MSAIDTTGLLQGILNGIPGLGGSSASGLGDTGSAVDTTGTSMVQSASADSTHQLQALEIQKLNTQVRDAKVSFQEAVSNASKGRTDQIQI